MFIASFPAGPWQTNCYLIGADGPDDRPGPIVVIDPGVSAGPVVEKALADNQLTLAGVICTHGHIDHVASAAELANAHDVPVWLHPADRAMLTEPLRGLGPGSEELVRQVLLGETTLPAPKDLRDLADGVSVEVAGLSFDVVHAPGHTPGCVVLPLDSGEGPIVFSGDVIFAGSIGRTDLPGGDQATMNSSLRRLREVLDSDATLFPGHGQVTKMSAELESNPYLQNDFLDQEMTY